MLHLRTEVTISDPRHHHAQVDKLFFFALVGRPSNRGQRHVDVFTALVASATTADGDYPYVSVRTTANGQDPSLLRDAGDEFFARVDVLRQFWGEGSRRLEHIEELQNHIDRDPRLLQELADIWPKQTTPARPLLLFEPVRASEPLLLMPRKPQAFEDGTATMVLPAGQGRAAALKLRVCFAMWPHASFLVPHSPVPQSIDFQHAVVFGGRVTPIREMRIYYGFPEKSELLLQSGSIHFRSSPSLTSPDIEFPVELHEVFSQATTIYFRTWNQLGINRSTLFRINPNARYEDACRSRHAAEVDLRTKLSESDVIRRRDRAVLIRSVLFATVVALGVDQTRLTTVLPLFPSAGSLTPTFWWIALCAANVPYLLPAVWPTNPRMASAFAGGTAVASLLWLCVAFMLAPEAQRIANAPTWAPLVCTSAIFCGAATFLFQRLPLAKYRARLAGWRTRRRRGNQISA